MEGRWERLGFALGIVITLFVIISTISEGEFLETFGDRPIFAVIITFGIITALTTFFGRSIDGWVEAKEEREQRENDL